jgi:hypothetical protein
MRPNKFQKRAFFLFGLFGAVQSLMGLFLLWRIPSDTKNGILFGLSLERFALLGGMILSGVIFTALSVGAWRNSSWFERLSQGWIEHLQKPKVWGIWVVSSILFLISGIFFTIITPEITEPFAAAYFLRLQPYALFVAGLSAQTLLALPLMRFGAEWKQKLRETPELMHIALLYGVFLLIGGGLQIHLSSVGPDPVGWNSLGTPILDIQVMFVFLVGIALVWVGMVWRKPFESERVKQNGNGWKVDALICVALWIAAAWYWHSLPLTNNWYVSAPRYPSFEYYPNSDGMVYDTTAQSLLSGEGYKSSHLPYPRRPLYDLFLFLLYLVKGQDFEAVVSLQSVIFAIFPVLVYLMTKTMHSRLAGVIAGMLVLLREGNAIALTNTITVSHSKMTMSDFPTAIGVALLTWIAFRWLNAPKRMGLILAAGGILAALMQIRIETGIFLPVVFGIALLQLPRLKTRYFTSLLAFIFCMFLVLSPWVWRNWKMTGLIFLEVPDNRLSFLLYRFQQSSEDESPEIPVEQEGGKIITPRQRKHSPISSEMIPAQSSPPTFAQILTNHWVHSQAQAVLMFPNTYRIFDSTIGMIGHKTSDIYWKQCCSGRDYVKRLPYWEWGKWSGEIPPQSVVPVLVNLFILTLGFRQVWKRYRWNGLLPLFFCFAYYLANGLARTSGGRYIFPVEWIWIGYYSIGLAYLNTSVFQLFGTNPYSLLVNEIGKDKAPIENEKRQAWTTYLGISLGFFLLGTSIPAAETIFPSRYTVESMANWRAELEAADDQQTIVPQIQLFFANGGTVWQGRGYYPRYYPGDQGEPGSLYPAVYPYPYPRLSIFLVGPRGIGVVLPLRERPDIRAENAADVLVFGCLKPGEKGDYFDALAMFYPSTDEIFVREPFPETLGCPLPEP